MTDRDGALRDAAAMWWSRMHGPDAETLRGEFESWRAASPRHAEEYAILERTWDLAAGLGATEIGRSRTLKRQARPLAWATAPRVAWAAAAMIVIAVAVGFWPSMPGVMQPVAIAHATDIGEVRTFALPDGSSVTMDTDSRISVMFDGAVRRVKLERGRARFEIRPDAARSFIVEAESTRFAANDARFDVSVASDGPCASALRGAIEVTGRGTPSPLRLEQGKTIRLAGSGAPLATGSDAAKGSDQWVSGMLVYQGAPLADVLAETNRYSRQKIELADRSLGALKVTGTFKPLPTDALAASLAAAFGLTVQRGPKGNLVLTRPRSS